MLDLVMITETGAILLLLLFGLWALCGYLGHKIAVDRGRNGGVGLVIGLIFGFVGLAVVWLLLSESAEHKILKEAEMRKRLRELDLDD